MTTSSRRWLELVDDVFRFRDADFFATERGFRFLCGLFNDVDILFLK